MTLLLLIAATALLAFAAGWRAHRPEQKPSEWWDGWQVGRDRGYQAANCHERTAKKLSREPHPLRVL